MDRTFVAEPHLLDWGLAGSRVLVTGASRGIGREFIRYFAEVGATVVACARTIDKLREAAAEINDSGGRAVAVEMDTSDIGSMRAAMDEAEDQVGPIDVLVNNAAISPYENALDQDVGRWDAVQDVNVRGPWFLSTEVGRRMRESNRSGAIVNIASIAGIGRSAFLSGYCTSKAALIQLTSCLSLELAAFDIRVNAIAPGIIESGMADKFVDTPQGRAILKRVPLGRFGTPQDLKWPLLWLSSPHSSFVTGTCVVIDGGLLGGAI